MKKVSKMLIFVAAVLFTAPKLYAQISIGISISAHIAPPELPVYTQPVCPNDGYIWTPGYWAYEDNDGYYWVPGVWVRPPHYGYLWTPAYWGYDGGVYGFHGGYWGAHVGFYGGVNYGYGYGGVGFGGGVWAGNSFRYNTAVANVNTTVVHNTYVNNTVINNTTVNNRTSFNGQGGVAAHPTQQEQTAMNEHHVQPTGEQMTHQQTASQDKSQFASNNHGRPATAAMNTVGGQHFNGSGRPAGSTPQRSMQAQHQGNPATDNAAKPGNNQSQPAQHQQPAQQQAQQQQGQHQQPAQQQQRQQAHAQQQQQRAQQHAQQHAQPHNKPAGGGHEHH